MSSINIKISEEVIDPVFWTEQVSAPECGAQVCFLGIVRNKNHGKKVVAVAYDAHEGLCKKILTSLSQETQEKFGNGLHILILHRTGKLSVGEASVMILVSSPHRDAAYQASRYLIEELKHRAPIWKKEFYEDGETEWLKGHALCEHHSSDPSGGTIHAHGHK